VAVDALWLLLAGAIVGALAAADRAARRYN